MHIRLCCAACSVPSWMARAVTAAQALDVVKADLKALNADVTVSQEEYDEVVAIKPMFLNAEYQ